MIRLRSPNLNCFCPSPPSSALASSPWFSPEFPYHLPSTTPHPPAGSPDISVKTRFFSSAGFQGLCQVPLGLQSITHLLGHHLLAHLCLMGLVRPDTIARTSPAFSRSLLGPV